jgi:hypothetical protein
MADARSCLVTLPVHGPPGPAKQGLFGWGASYGNDDLWVGGLWPHGVIDAGPSFVDHFGRVVMKFGWWREVAGQLRITGRRLDASAPPVRSDIPNGYGSKGFQATGVIFPTEGCWEVTGTVDGSSLSFVTFVIMRANAGS